ncbi:hypothetical protein COZ61_00165 [Candidatus Berkelbacteria bacterium CG_4_8_14_3_um_filter_33_6]|nr:MAG: hypothetical protein COZ61_00165 [Candidatus Berkelbacteria bacterium CG_4_8_14_3_um_filter_33_6]PJB51609.1 MAG: hypothetical protein CO100_01975 [Candidatus Berkelbacteria bacterium CG_4_9_14_3_um_filter_33_5]
MITLGLIAFIVINLFIIKILKNNCRSLSIEISTNNALLISLITTLQIVIIMGIASFITPINMYVIIIYSIVFIFGIFYLLLHKFTRLNFKQILRIAFAIGISMFLIFFFFAMIGLFIAFYFASKSGSI